MKEMAVEGAVRIKLFIESGLMHETPTECDKCIRIVERDRRRAGNYGPIDQ
jgi:hypothetical protein